MISFRLIRWKVVSEIALDISCNISGTLAVVLGFEIVMRLKNQNRGWDIKKKIFDTKKTDTYLLNHGQIYPAGRVNNVNNEKHFAEGNSEYIRMKTLALLNVLYC